jgi:hypothetical protein
MEAIALPAIFVQNFWAGLAVWATLFVSDYALTITCARLYQRGVCDKIVLEGSYEITPYFQRDIDSLRRVSPRFILALLWSSAVLFVLWRLVGQSMPEMYCFALGAMILVQLAVHMRHFRNLFLFRAAASDAVRGRIEYCRRLVLRSSSLELLEFSGLFFALFAFTHSWFVLGGGVACLSVAGKHWRLGRRQASAAAQAGNYPETPTAHDLR